MPNHIKNRLTISGDTTEVLAQIAGENGVISFQKIVPMPEELLLDGEELNLVEWAKIAIGVINLATLRDEPKEHPAESVRKKDWGAAADALERASAIRKMNEGPFPKDFTPERFEEFMLYVRNLFKYGHCTWYGWSRENWGTKWDAYESEVDANGRVVFETAWSTPFPVIVALSKRFPDKKLILEWADEDTGNNAGSISIQNGEPEGGLFDNQSQAAYEMAFELRPSKRDDYEMVDGKYQYKETPNS